MLEQKLNTVKMAQAVVEKQMTTAQEIAGCWRNYGGDEGNFDEVARYASGKLEGGLEHMKRIRNRYGIQKSEPLRRRAVWG